MAKNNSRLRKAAKEKNDEFYTTMQDIEKECFHYREHFRGKTIFCNCDDPKTSAFWRYFHLNFNFFGLRRLIATHFEKDGKPSYALIFDGGGQEEVNDVEVGNVIPLQGDGDFRSPECIEFLKEADIVVTNPPFSLFREYVAQLIEYDKKFIIIGNMNAITYKEIFPLIRDGKLWIGHGFNMPMIFKTPYPNTKETNRKSVVSRGFNPDAGFIITPACAWFTNLDHKKRHEPLLLWREYAKTPELYPRYDNYDAINVNKVADIPMDYDGLIGVPITMLQHYCLEQFEIVDALNRYSMFDLFNTNDSVKTRHSHMCNINGKATYFRIIIKRKKNN